MNKLLVITGGTKGIGRAIINAFASKKFDIVTCARHHQELQQLKQEIGSTHQVEVFVHQADVSDKAQVKLFCDFVTNLKRPVEVLVNNAGYFIPGEITTEPEGTLEHMINAHLYSAYHTIRALAPDMKAERNGHIINMCSIASLKAYANGGSYAIAKAALLSLSKNLREELKSFNIRVTAIMPGATWTASWEGVNLPEERFMKAQDVADAVYGAYALSKQSVVEEIIIRPQLGDI